MKTIIIIAIATLSGFIVLAQLNPNTGITMEYEDVKNPSVASSKLAYPADALQNQEAFVIRALEEKPINFLGVPFGSTADSNVTATAYCWNKCWYRIGSEAKVFGEAKRLSIYMSMKSRTIFTADVSYHFEGEDAYEKREFELKRILDFLNRNYGVTGKFLIRSKQMWAEENAEWLARKRCGAGGVGTADYDLGNGLVCRVRCHDALGREPGKENVSIYVSFIYPVKMFLAKIEAGKEYFNW